MTDSTWWRQRYGGPPPAPLTIICTGRGAHPRTVLLGVHVFTHSGHVELSSGHLGIRATGAGRLVAGEPAGSLQRARVPRVPKTGECTRDALDAADAWEFSCPRCARTPRVRKAALTAAAHMGWAEVDVSRGD